MSEPILRVRGLTVTFAGSGHAVPAVRGIDFDVYANQVLCIVGESGSGNASQGFLEGKRDLTFLTITTCVLGH